MDDHWYYAEASDRSYGPMTIEELGRVLSANANAIDFLVWCPGMVDWGRAGDQIALRRYLRPPPIPAHPDTPPLSASSAHQSAVDEAPQSIRLNQDGSSLHPWRRYFARMFDLYLFCLVFFMFLGLAFPKLFATSDRGLDALYGIFGSAAYAVFEGFCMNVFGSTIGKRLYGIAVVRSSGDGLPLSVSFQRSFAVWVRGLGLGIPIVTLFTLITAYRTLMREKLTSWDRDFQCMVMHQKLSPRRWILILFVWVLVAVVYMLLAALADTKP